MNEQPQLSAMGQGQAGQGQAPQQPQQGTIEQVIELLMKGATPEELLQMGVPEEMIRQAIELVQQHQAQQEQAQGSVPEGLSGMATPQQI